MEALHEYIGPDAVQWLEIGRELLTLAIFGIIGLLGIRRTVRAIRKPKDPELVVVTDHPGIVNGRKSFTLLGTWPSLKAVDRILNRSTLRDVIGVDRGGHKRVFEPDPHSSRTIARKSPRGVWTIEVPVQLAADFRAILSVIPGVALTGDDGLAHELRTGATLTGPLQREWRELCKESRQT